jgi:hypothetical protein
MQNIAVTPMEPIEIPNTDYKAARGESYVTVYNGNGQPVAYVHPDWSLFDLELWCRGFEAGYNQGHNAGRRDGRENVSRAIKDALGI